MTMRVFTEDEKSALLNRLDAVGGKAFMRRNLDLVEKVECTKVAAECDDWQTVADRIDDLEKELEP